MAGITGLLTDLLHKDRNFVWGEDAEAAFQELKKILVSPPVLRIADPSRLFEVVTDASDFVIGAAAERKFPIHDKEMLAIIHAFKSWRCYLVGADVTVRTDHKSLQYLQALPNLNPWKIRWLDYMESHFTYRITYKKGANNIADALTRLTVQSAAVLIHHSNPLLTGLFTHRGPRFQRSGHLEVDKTQKLLHRHYYWPNSSNDVQRYVSSCRVCRAMKSTRQRPAGLLQPLEPPERPWQQVTMDFVTRMPAGPTGNDAVLVVVNRLTKMAHFAPFRTTITAEEIAIFDLDFDAILAAMYAVSISVLHTFTLDSGASRSFFRDRTTLTLLSRPVAVSLADPSGGPVLARYSTVLPCPAAPSGSLSGLYLPSFSINLVSGANLQDAGVDQFTPASQRVTHCTCAQTGRHLAMFTRRPESSLYTLTTASPPVAASGQVAASSQVFAAASRSGPESAPCSCRLLSHQTLLWHHRLGHPHTCPS
ncbi:unnamed protein product [Closterium sp. NIES-54]